MVEDEEQQSILTNRNTFVSFRISNETLKKIDRYLCWNSKILMTIKANFSNFSDLFYLSGSSRYTFYKEHSWELEKKSYILLNSNFSLLSNYESVEKYLDFRSSLSNITLDHVQIEGYKKSWQETVYRFRKFIFIARELTRKKYPILIRLHPSEKIKNFKKVLKQENAMDLCRYISISDELLPEQLKYAHLLLHFGCSSAYEANLMGIPEINLLNRDLDYEYLEKIIDEKSEPDESLSNTNDYLYNDGDLLNSNVYVSNFEGYDFKHAKTFNINTRISFVLAEVIANLKMYFNIVYMFVFSSGSRPKTRRDKYKLGHLEKYIYKYNVRDIKLIRRGSVLYVKK